MVKALLVDDEKRMLDLLALYLRPHSFICKKAISAKGASSFLKEETFDIVLIDIMMPEMNGWKLCQEIRKDSDIPIIMVSAREQKENIIKGLKLDEDELLARIEAVLRRMKPARKIEVNGLLWNEDEFELSYKNNTLKLTPKEFTMLGYFMRKPNQVYTREQLIELIWGYDSHIEGRTVDSHVRNMRDKIRQSGFPIDDYLITVWGIGYKWVNKPSL